MSVPKVGPDGVRRYGTGGQVEDVTKCAEEVWDTRSRGMRHYQCTRKRGHGPDGMYCGNHDPARLAKRAEVREHKWKMKKEVERMARVGYGLREATVEQLRGELKRRGEV